VTTANRDAEASAHEFDLMVAAHQRRLGQFLVQMVGSGELAEDLLQETFLAAYRDRHQMAGLDSVTAWLFAIARNRALHALRTRRRREAGLRRLALLFQDTDDDPSEAVAVRELLEQHLDADERALLILRYLHGFDSRELAEIVNASPEAVRQRLSRARRRLLDQVAAPVDAAPVRRGPEPVEPAGPEIVGYRPGHDDIGDADARRLATLLAPLATITPVMRREPTPRFSWRRLRGRVGRS
jgi:RNA polymerase sigma factor (sigma-70 family)